MDFNYEVSRSLAACEGAHAGGGRLPGHRGPDFGQHLPCHRARPGGGAGGQQDRPAQPPTPTGSCHEIEDIIGIPALDAPRISAKTGLNIEEVLERIVTDIPAPKGDADAPLQALIFDSYYDSYKGVIVYIRVMEGTVRPGDDHSA